MRVLAPLLSVVLLACQPAAHEEPHHPKAHAIPSAELIPREVLFGNPERASVQISPDGAHISWLAPVDGVLNVWLAPREDLDAARAVTNDTVRGIRSYRWTYGGQLVYVQDQGGDENYHLYEVDLETEEAAAVDLTPMDGVRAQISGMSPEHPDEMVVGLNDRDPRYHDLYHLDLTTGELTLVMQNDEGFAGYLLDNDLEVRLAFAPTEDGGMDVLTRAGEAWEPLLSIPQEDALTTGPEMFDATNTKLLMTDSRGRDTSALVELDLATGESTVLAEDRKADLSDLIVHPTEHRVQAAAFTHTRKQWTVLDPELEADLARLAEVADGEIEIVQRTLDDQLWTVAYLMDTGPVRYYLYDRASGEATFLFTNRPELDELTLAPMHPVVITSRDQQELVSYLTLPVGADADADGVPDAPVPMVLWVHGGPWARDSWGYNPYHQWFADRGYAVLSVNYRGSTGFGKAFTNAGDLEWGARMHTDLLDAVQWAIDAGVTSPDAVAIGGGSYGGYATLVGMTFTPEVFACGVDIVGPSSLVTLIESVPPYWAPMIATFHSRVGDPTTDEGRAFLESRSPLHRADAIVRPLLIGQGQNDPRVKKAEADQIVAAMQANGQPVTYVSYPDEGHGFARPANRMSFNAVTEAFLAECLGGAAEPYGNVFDGSTAQVLAGAEYVTGLADAAPPLPADAQLVPAEPAAPAEPAPAAPE